MSVKSELDASLMRGLFERWRSGPASSHEKPPKSTASAPTLQPHRATPAWDRSVFDADSRQAEETVVGAVHLVEP